MRGFKFYKESDNRWYVDLPEWTGEKADLEMVAGADVMLEYMAEGENDVTVYLSEDKFEGSDELTFISNAEDIGNGAYYKLTDYRGINIDLTMWLCDVTLFVFGHFPAKIHILAYQKN